MPTQFDIVLLEKDGVKGLTRTNCMDLFDMLKDEEAYPIEITSQTLETSVMGFIGKTADKALDYNHEELTKFVENTISSPEERNTFYYKFKGLDLYLSD